jgi:hypothetical protein
VVTGRQQKNLPPGTLPGGQADECWYTTALRSQATTQASDLQVPPLRAIQPCPRAAPVSLNWRIIHPPEVLVNSHAQAGARTGRRARSRLPSQRLASGLCSLEEGEYLMGIIRLLLTPEEIIDLEVIGGELG